jgi:hypothetical protein
VSSGADHWRGSAQLLLPPGVPELPGQRDGSVPPAQQQQQQQQGEQGEQEVDQGKVGKEGKEGRRRRQVQRRESAAAAAARDDSPWGSIGDSDSGVLVGSPEQRPPTSGVWGQELRVCVCCSVGCG